MEHIPSYFPPEGPRLVFTAFALPSQLHGNCRRKFFSVHVTDFVVAVEKSKINCVELKATPLFACYRPATNMYAANGPAVPEPEYNNTMVPKQSNYNEPRSAPGPSPNLSQRPMQPQTPPSFDDRCVFRVAFNFKHSKSGL